MILLDTCAALWLTGQKDRLSESAREALANTRNRSQSVSLSDITLWEVSLLSTRGRITLPTPLPAFLKYLEKSFAVLPISAAVAQRSMDFSDAYPRNPADRIIGATALVHGLRLITADLSILKSGEVPCIW